MSSTRARHQPCPRMINAISVWYLDVHVMPESQIVQIILKAKHLRLLEYQHNERVYKYVICDNYVQNRIISIPLQI